MFFVSSFKNYYIRPLILRSQRPASAFEKVIKKIYIKGVAKHKSIYLNTI